VYTNNQSNFMAFENMFELVSGNNYHRNVYVTKVFEDVSKDVIPT